MRLPAPISPRIEQSDRRRSQHEQSEQMLVLGRFAEGRVARTIRPSHTNRTHEQEELPEPAEIHVLIALVAEPEIAGKTQLLLYTQPLPKQRPDHDDQQAHEQEVDPARWNLGSYRETAER